ncbi:MAG: preprotein translocase subunit SecG [Halocynthiibacter sp.]
MENVILVVHLILSIALIGIVLLQRSEGGGLGMGGGGGGDGIMSGRSAATALSKLTWILAAGFFATSVTMTIIAAKNSSGNSVIDQIGAKAPTVEAPLETESNTLLPPAQGTGTLTPPSAE